MSELAQQNHFWKNFRGSVEGDYFEKVLGPAGFIREFLVQHGPSRGQAYHLDFAHVSGKVNIELDGPLHLSSPQEDAVRDVWLKSRGWKIIRIKHG